MPNSMIHFKPSSDHAQTPSHLPSMQVSQDPVLFTGTIADNIAYGKYGKASPAEVRVTEVTQLLKEEATAPLPWPPCHSGS